MPRPELCLLPGGGLHPMAGQLVRSVQRPGLLASAHFCRAVLAPERLERLRDGRRPLVWLPGFLPLPNVASLSSCCSCKCSPNKPPSCKSHSLRAFPGNLTYDTGLQPLGPGWAPAQLPPILVFFLILTPTSNSKPLFSAPGNCLFPGLPSLSPAPLELCCPIQ